MIEIYENKDIDNLKKITKYVLEDFGILNIEKSDNLLSASIKNEKTFYSILELFYSLYILEKLYSQMYPISLEGIKNEELEKELKRHLRSAIPRDKQAYLINFGSKVAMVTYFRYHDEHVNPFGKKNILVGNFVKAFKSFERKAHMSSKKDCQVVLDCPIILAFIYNYMERIHILKNNKMKNNGIDCDITINFGSFECKRENNECTCLKKIQEIIIKDPENRDCNLRILGGSQMFFDIEYNLIERLISLEDISDDPSKNPLKKRGYEPIYNFLLACYLSDKVKAKFNTNVKLKIDEVEKETDIILFSNSWTSIIETTREHAICREKEYSEKIEKSILSSIPLHSQITKNQTFYYILISLTPESKFAGSTHYVAFAKKHFNFEHIGIPDEREVVKYIDNPKYFSPSKIKRILNHQLEMLIDVLDNNK